MRSIGLGDGKTIAQGLLLVLAVQPALAQNAAAISRYFEGKQVVVKMDMPGTQQGVDIYPQRPQPIDMKSYTNRLKKFGTAIHNGDSVMITKVKVKNDNIEFQLGGGGFGTASDDSDTSVHFTPDDKSQREKELEDQLGKETDADRRRSLQRELDDVRSSRERQDRRNRARAEDAADSKKQQVDMQRMQGGSRFNIHLDTRKMGDELTPERIMADLDRYVSFRPGESAQPPAAASPNYSGPPPTPQSLSGDQEKSLKKGLTFDQVKAIFGEPTSTHDAEQNGMKMTSSTFQDPDHTVKADFVNGVLVQYTVSSR